MKTTIDISERELKEVMNHTGARTKTEAVNRAVADFNRRQRMMRLAERLGTFQDMLTAEDLLHQRETS